MAQRKQSNLSAEASDSLFMLVESSSKLAKKERKFIYATVAGDLKWISAFLGIYWPSKADWFDPKSPVFPLFRTNSYLGFKKTDDIALRRLRKLQETVE